MAVQAGFLYSTLKATKLSADATRLAADAAKKAADVAEKSVNSLERPYLLVESVASKIIEHMVGSTLNSERPQVVVTLKNYGRSPALISELRGSLQLIQPGTDRFDIPGIPLGNIAVIAPGGTKDYTFRYTYAVSEGLLSQVTNEVLHFWFFISVRYLDMLDREHKLEMRFKYARRDDGFLMVRGDSRTV
jgi:hypothetical protein